MNLNNVDLNKIRILRAVVNNGSHQRAGEELGLTRSAISQALSVLEYQMDLKLFLRKGRHLYPTDDARKISQLFENYEFDLGHCLKGIRGEFFDLEGSVRIGSNFEFAKHHLVPKIENFCRENKKVQIRMIFDSPSRLLNLVEQGRLDLCFSIFPYQGRKRGMESKKVFENELVALVPKTFYHNEFSEEDIVSLPSIEYYKSHQLLPRWYKIHYGKKYRGSEARIYGASSEMLLELVSQGLGFAIVPKYLVTKKVLEKSFVFQPSKKKLKGPTWMIYFKNQFQNSAHEALLQWLAQSSF